MATTKRGTRAHSKTAAGRPKKKVTKTVAATAKRAASTKKAPKPAAAKTPKRPVVAAKAKADTPEVASLKARFQRERSQLDKRLTEAMREIGVLRHHEMRAAHLERQLQERDDLVARLQRQLTELERRPATEPVYEREVQQTMVFVATGEEVDEFEEVVDDDDGVI